MATDEGSVREWLDNLKPGFGARFAAAFEEIGVEDVADLLDVDEEAQQELEEALKKAGAKTIQLKQLRKAVSAVVGESAGAKTILATSGSSNSSELPPQVAAAIAWRAKSKKKYACFISHHKAAAAMEARFIKGELERLLSTPCFLDSDDLRDLNQLLNYVVDSDVLVILQTKELFQRPWCLLECYTAIKEGIPIVALNCEGKGYDFQESSSLLTHLDSALEHVNPGAAEMIQHKAQVDIVDMAFKLSTVVPSIISIAFNSSASSNMLAGSFFDLVDAMVGATPTDAALLASDKQDAWLASRGTAPPMLSQHGDGAAAADGPPAGTATGGDKAAPTKAARCPPEVPQLPAGYQPRQAILDGIKKLLFRRPTTASEAAAGGGGGEGAAAPQPPDGPKPTKTGTGGRTAAFAASEQGVTRVSVQGLGGSGKTVVAAGLARDPEVAASSELMVYVALGQTPVLRECQRTMYRQLTGSALDPNLATEEDAMSAIIEATAGKKVLLILDDAWNKDIVLHFESALDSRTDSRLVVTTRIKTILPKISEFELGLLEPDDACALLLEVAGLENTGAPHSELLYKACELSGHLPLMLSIAGSMLAQYGEELDEEFLALLQDDSAAEGSLRVGEFGDELVDLEDRLINSSLRSYTARDKKEVEELFYFLAVLPEDVPLHMNVLKTLSVHLEGPDQKHPGRKLRSWVTALIQMSLLKGSIGDGFFMHDIVRHFCQNKVGAEKLKANHKICVEAFLAGRSESKAFEMVGVASVSSLSYYCHNHLAWHIKESLEDRSNIDKCANDPLIISILMKDPDPLALGTVAMAVGGPSKCQAICEHLVSAGGREVEAAAFLMAGSFSRHLDGLTHSLEKKLLISARDIICTPEIVQALSAVMSSHVSAIFGRLAPLLVGSAAEDPDAQTVNEAKFKIFSENNKFENFETVFGGWMGKHWPNFQKNVTYGSKVGGLSITKEAMIEAYRFARPPRDDIPELAAEYGLGIVMKVYVLLFCSDFWNVYPYVGEELWFDFKSLEEAETVGGADEATMLKLIEDYTYEDSVKAKGFAMGIDMFIFPRFCDYLLFKHGNLECAELYLDKVFGILEKCKADNGNDGAKILGIYLNEAWFYGPGIPCICFTIGRPDLAKKLDDLLEMDSQEKIDAFWEACGPYREMIDDQFVDIFDLPKFIRGGAAALREDLSVDKLLKAPEVYARMDDACYLCNSGQFSMLSLAMWAFEKNDDDAKASECADLALEGGNQKRIVPKVNAWLCRGRIAQRKGDEAAAIVAFQAAADVAIKEYAPMLAIIAGRDCGGVKGEAMIQRGLEALPNKSRADFAALDLPPAP